MGVPGDSGAFAGVLKGCQERSKEFLRLQRGFHGSSRGFQGVSRAYQVIEVAFRDISGFFNGILRLSSGFRVFQGISGRFRWVRTFQSDSSVF